MRTAYYKKALRPIKRVAASGVVATKVSEDWRQTLGTLPAVANPCPQSMPRLWRTGRTFRWSQLRQESLLVQPNLLKFYA